jgi:hypothetical protein
VLHTGVLPVHSWASVPEHWTQAPLARHTGFVAVGHGFGVVVSPLSPLQLTQVLAALHTGVFPVQSE